MGMCFVHVAVKRVFWGRCAATSGLPLLCDEPLACSFSCTYTQKTQMSLLMHSSVPSAIPLDV